MPDDPSTSSPRCGTPRRKGARSAVPASVSLSLPVIPPPVSGAQKVRRSRTARWRAAVLIAVNLAFAGHLVMWILSGMRDGVRETVSPVEPSESMYTLETGIVNAGFIFFAAALLSTLLLGRFFCGWGCHVVSLQDLCSWIMTRIRVKPRPFRSRLLMWVPLFFAFYMFVWPTARRWLRQVLDNPASTTDIWDRLRPWLGDSPNLHGWTAGLIVEDFWKTFPPWYIAIPFLLICGFAVVYFLGSKGFCTYGCPYGGFFGPADMLAVGKIRVTDACEHCGHCTAVCTSNVRVHEEVRDFGMVVDPGCMKCMDCISVCPNDALYFGLGKPTIAARPRDEAAKARRAAMHRNWDLSWPEELLVAAVFVAAFLAWRGFMNDVPMLMAIGLAGISGFFAWKLLRMLRDPHVRLQSLQLKYRGRLKRAGWLFAPVAVLFLATGAWAGVVKFHRWRAGMVAWDVTVPVQQVLATGPATGTQRILAESALAHYRQSGPIQDGGWGWALRPDDLLSVAYLQVVCGRIADAEATMNQIMQRGRPTESLVAELSQVMRARGASDDEINKTYERILEQQPRLTGVRAYLAQLYAQKSRIPDAEALYEKGIKLLPGDSTTRKDAGMLMVQLGRATSDSPKTQRGLALMEEAEKIAEGKPGMKVRRSAEAMLQVGRAYMLLNENQRAVRAFQKTLEMNPMLPGARLDLATALFLSGQTDRGLSEMQRAADEAPLDPGVADHYAQMLEAAGKTSEAAAWHKRAADLAQPQRGAPSQPPP